MIARLAAESVKKTGNAVLSFTRESKRYANCIPRSSLYNGSFGYYFIKVTEEDTVLGRQLSNMNTCALLDKAFELERLAEVLHNKNRIQRRNASSRNAAFQNASLKRRTDITQPQGAYLEDAAKNEEQKEQTDTQRREELEQKYEEKQRLYQETAASREEALKNAVRQMEDAGTSITKSSSAALQQMEPFAGKANQAPAAWRLKYPHNLLLPGLNFAPAVSPAPDKYFQSLQFRSHML